MAVEPIEACAANRLGRPADARHLSNSDQNLRTIGRAATDNGWLWAATTGRVLRLDVETGEDRDGLDTLQIGKMECIRLDVAAE